MQQRTFRLIALLAGTFVLLFTTATAAFSAQLSPVQQTNMPSNTPLTQEALEQFWQEMYPSAEPFEIAAHTNVYTHELLAKASPDECFNGIGVPMTNTLPECAGGQPKVNEAYVWGLTDHEETIWFGTAPNVHCLVMGGYLGSTAPIQTNPYVCEFGESQYAPPLPDIIGDWRPPSLYVYDNASQNLTEVSPVSDPRFISNTLGIRSAATSGDYVFFAGPAFTPTDSINIFLFNANTRTYMGAANLVGYNNVRKWLEVDGILYVGVGTPTGGAILRYTGNPTSGNPADWFTFEQVGTLADDAAELAVHEGRLFVNTWPVFTGPTPEPAGLYMGPVIPPGGLTTSHSDPSNWVKVFSYDEYEPDPVVARTYGGGALYSYQGDLFWGTMHVPMVATLAHMSIYAEGYYTREIPSEVALPTAMVGNQRSISIFQGRNFGTADQEIEVAYGMPQLPAFDGEAFTWIITDTRLGPPKYGLSGFDNLFNNYTWSMAEYDGQLFVGTMDWSYLITSIFDSIFDEFELPIDIEITLPDVVNGADLYRFYSTTDPALPESKTGVGNYTNYGVRNMLGREDGLYLGMANPMNLLTDPTDDKPEGGWELLRLTRHLLPLTVTVTGTGGGSVASDPAGIDCGPTCTSAYDYGTTVILTPTANMSSTFTGWSGACVGLDVCEVTLFESQDVTANFTLNTYPLVVVLEGDGSGSVSSVPAGIGCSQPSCSADFDIGTAVSLSAVAFSGSSFEGWSGACTGSGNDLCQVTISPGTTVVTATFSQNPQQGNIKVDGLPYVGTPLTLTASLNMNPVNECTWDFGNGETEACELGTPDTVQSAGVDAVHDVTIQTTHTYTQAGIYIVMVTATNDAGTVVLAEEITIQVPTAEEPNEQPMAPGDLYFPFLNR